MRHIYRLFFCAITYFLLISFAGGPASTNFGDYTGSPDSDGTCANCHGAIPVFGVVTASIEFIDKATGLEVTEWLSGGMYQIRITVNNTVGTPLGYGFQSSVYFENEAASITAPSTNVQIAEYNFGIQKYIAEHTSLSPNPVFSYEWHAPIIALQPNNPVSKQATTVTIYATGNALNGNGNNSGDTGSTAPTVLNIPYGGLLNVELNSFTGEAVEYKSQLNWSTTTETNNDHFAIEHSLDGNDFNPIGMIQGVGTTTEEQHYEFLHARPANGQINYYRLKIVDTDGAYTYSATISIDIKQKSPHPITIFPIPANDIVTIDIRADEPTAYQIQISDSSGKVISSNKSLIKTGFNQIEIQTASWPNGIYIVHLTSTSEKFVRQIIKL